LADYQQVLRRYDDLADILNQGRPEPQAKPSNRPSQLRGKSGNSHREHMLSALPPKADIR
jgi:hypothetical protein